MARSKWRSAKDIQLLPAKRVALIRTGAGVKNGHDCNMTVTVTPLGAARTVTGSRHLIEAGDVRVLVDCGLYQERDLVQRNWDEFPVDPRSISAVVMTHAHLDHSGYLPKLVAEGYAGRIFATHATAAIIPILLADSAHIMEEDAKTKQRRHRKEHRQGKHGPARPLYTERDVDRAVRKLTPVPFGQRTEVHPKVWVTWQPAGHILGAAILLVEIAGKRLVFSGDLGRPDRPIVPDPSLPPACDALIVESTYGDRVHPPQQDVERQIEAVVQRVVKADGKVLIPTFAVERAQELIWHLDRMYTAGRLPPIPVFLDSPMAVNLLAVFSQHEQALDEEARARLKSGDSPFAFEHLRLTKSREDSMAINDVTGPAIIIAGSGMCNGGRIKHHLRKYINDPNSCLLFTGYQAHGTLGRLLVDGAQRVRLFNHEVDVAIQIEQIHGFSGHADRDECLAWLGSWAEPAKQVIVVHGGATVAPAFATLVTQRFGVPASAPRYLESVTVP